MNNTLSNLGLCRRAGALVIGFDAVCDAIRGGKAAAVLLCGDVSAKTRKEIHFTAQKQGLEPDTLPLCMDDMRALFHKRVGVFAITDPGLAGMLRGGLNRQGQPAKPTKE